MLTLLSAASRPCSDPPHTKDDTHHCRGIGISERPRTCPVTSTEDADREPPEQPNPRLDRVPDVVHAPARSADHSGAVVRELGVGLGVRLSQDRPATSPLRLIRPTLAWSS